MNAQLLRRLINKQGTNESEDNPFGVHTKFQRSSLSLALVLPTASLHGLSAMHHISEKLRGKKPVIKRDVTVEQLADDVAFVKQIIQIGLERLAR